MLGHSEAVRDQPPEPVCDVKDIIVLFFLVHGGHDLVDLGTNGRVVTLSPVQEGVCTCSGGVEAVGAPVEAHGVHQPPKDPALERLAAGQTGLRPCLPPHDAQVKERLNTFQLKG